MKDHDKIIKKIDHLLEIIDFIIELKKNNKNEKGNFKRQEFKTNNINDG